MNDKASFIDYASRIRLPNCSKLAVNWKNGNGVIIFRQGVTVKFSCHLNIVTGSGIMTLGHEHL